VKSTIKEIINNTGSNCNPIIFNKISVLFYTLSHCLDSSVSIVSRWWTALLGDLGIDSWLV
jgi:hypothetical protein